MERKISHYEEIVGVEMIEEIRATAQPLNGLSLLNINSTAVGGGVAEMLHTLIPLFNDIGIGTRWEVIKGTPLFFNVTKKIHNALQGENLQLSEEMQAEYQSVNRKNAARIDLSADVVVIHDPQPLPLIDHRRTGGPWVWRCHIDLSNPNADVWEKLKPYVLRYDAVVVSSESFKKADLPVKTYVIPPAIDPFSPINRPLTADEINAKLAEYKIPQDKPLIVQVSRFDKWKDPLGVIEVFSRVRKEADARLVMLGNMASDDPEGPTIYENVRKAAAGIPDVHLITETDPLLVNALQRSAAVVLQISLKEGFGLTVSEALWKGTPVIATNVGGIPLQIEDGKMGYLVTPRDYESMSARVLDILGDPDLRAKLGEAGREHVRKKFLMPRLIYDWLNLIGKIVA